MKLTGANDVDLSSVVLPEWVADLRRLLEDGDVAAQQLWNDKGEELKNVLPGAMYVHLRRAIDSFDFDAALAALAPAYAAK